MGPAVKLDAPEDSNVYDYMRTTYNEYVVRDEARVKIRYMVLVRHNDYCFLCQSLTNRNHLKPLKDHEFGPDGFSCVDVNSFEQQIFGMYLQDIEKTPKQLFDEKLPGFLKNQNSSKYKIEESTVRFTNLMRCYRQIFARMVSPSRHRNHKPSVWELCKEDGVDHAHRGTPATSAK